jgi:CTP synthase
VPALIARRQATWKEWQSLTKGQERFFETVSIALVGKYVSLHDSYLSVIKSLEHAAMHCGKKLNLIWVDASNLEDESKTTNPADFHRGWHGLSLAGLGYAARRV